MTDNTKKYDCIVIGGGSSGMMAAGKAAKDGKSVLLLERQGRLGAKLSITGGGRCNITNAERNIHKLLSNYGSAEKFLYSPFSQFGVDDTFSFFSTRGLPLVVQEENRAFPETENADDVVDVMINYVKSNGVEVKTNTKVTELIMKEEKIIGVSTEEGKYFGNSFIIATGSYARTESDRDNSGISFLRTLGHTVRKPSPNIVPLKVKDTWVHELSGTTLSSMRINFFLDGERKFSKSGELLFTHFGISGPLILNSSQRVSKLLENGSVTATVDTFPHTNIGQLDNQVLKVFDENQNKQLKNVVTKISPEGISSALIQLLSVPEEKRINAITTDERKEILALLKALPMQIEGLMGFDRAVIADGGVSLDEIDTATMRSNIHKNLYLTGDILDINRPSGGYSLQLAWTTGFVAGSSIS
jgi:predicted Rossmann fold flavoprotein